MTPTATMALYYVLNDYTLMFAPCIGRYARPVGTTPIGSALVRVYDSWYSTRSAIVEQVACARFCDVAVRRSMGRTHVCTFVTLQPMVG